MNPKSKKLLTNSSSYDIKIEIFFVFPFKKSILNCRRKKNLLNIGESGTLSKEK